MGFLLMCIEIRPLFSWLASRVKMSDLCLLSEADKDRRDKFPTLPQKCALANHCYCTLKFLTRDVVCGPGYFPSRRLFLHLRRSEHDAQSGGQEGPGNDCEPQPHRVLCLPAFQLCICPLYYTTYTHLYQTRFTFIS